MVWIPFEHYKASQSCCAQMCTKEPTCRIAAVGLRRADVVGGMVPFHVTQAAHTPYILISRRGTLSQRCRSHRIRCPNTTEFRTDRLCIFGMLMHLWYRSADRYPASSSIVGKPPSEQHVSLRLVLCVLLVGCVRQQKASKQTDCLAPRPRQLTSSLQARQSLFSK